MHKSDIGMLHAEETDVALSLACICQLIPLFIARVINKNMRMMNQTHTPSFYPN